MQKSEKVSLRHSFLTGIKWTGGGKGVLALLQLLRLAILARLLTPSDFGLAAMVNVFLGYVQMHTDMGLTSAVIQRQDASVRHLSSLYWVSLLFGLVLFGLTQAVSPLVVRFFAEPRLADLLFWASLCLLINPFGQQFQALLIREMFFGTLAASEVAAGLTGFIVAVGCAYAGKGVYSLIWGQLAATSLLTSLYISNGWRLWRPSFTFSLDGLRPFFRFGMFQLGARTANYFYSVADRLIIGSVLGSENLGFYSLAQNVALRPLLLINTSLGKVLFPIFAKIQTDKKRLKESLFQTLRALNGLNGPVQLGLAVCAPAIVPLFFGPGWEPSIPLLRILAVVSLLHGTGQPAGALVYGVGRPDLALRFQILLFIVTIPAVYAAGLWSGAMAITWTLLFLEALFTAATYFLLLRPTIGACFIPYYSNFLKPLSAAALMSVCVLAAGGLPLAGQLVIGATVYPFFLRLTDRKAFEDILDMLLRVVGRRA